MCNNVVQRVKFEKFSNGIKSDCTITKFNDGSVYVDCNELDHLIYEFAPDNWEKAVRYVKELGFTELPAEE